MPHINTIRYNFEPGRGPKKRWLATRKQSTVIGGVDLPGLFQTSHPMLDAVCFFAALMLELFGIYVLYSLGQVGLLNALGLASLDIIAAMLSHLGLGQKKRVANELLLTNEPAAQEALRASLPWWHRALRVLGVILIVGLAAFKVFSFIDLVSSETGTGVVVLVAVSYGLAALLHILCTGYYLAEAYTAFTCWRERRATLTSKRRADSPWNIKAFRRHVFQSPIPLVAVVVGKHSLRLIKKIGTGGEYELLTWGILLDQEIQTFAEGQTGGHGTAEHQKAIIALECLRHQLRDILDKEPIGRTETLPASAEPAADEDALLAFDPLLPKPQSSSVRAIVTIAATSFALLQSACVQSKKKAAGEFPLDIIVGTIAEASVPEPLVAIIAPEKAYGPDWKPLRATPVIHRVDFAQPISSPLGVKLKTGLVRSFWGAQAPLGEQTQSIREGLKTMPLTEPFHRPFQGGDGLAKFIAKARKDGTAVIAYADGQPDFAGEKVPAFPDAAAISAEIARIQNETPGKRVAVLYSIAGSEKKNPPPPASGSTFRVAASDAWRDVLARLAAEYCRISGRASASTETSPDGRTITIRGTLAEQPAVIEIVDAGHSGAFASLVTESADAAFSARPISEQELAFTRMSGDARFEFPVGKDAIAIVSHPARSSGTISLGELRALFAGRTVGRAHAPASGSEVALLFRQLVLGEAAFASGVARHSTEREVLTAVAAESASIGFVSRRTLGASGVPLRVSADGDAIALEPNPATIARGYYPLIMPLHLYVPTRSEKGGDARLAAARAFASFVSTHPAAHELLEREGFVSNRLASAPPLAIEAPAARLPKFEADLRDSYTRTVQGAEALNVAIHFAFNKADLDRENTEAIERLVAEIRANPAYQDAEVLVVGFADSDGKAQASHAKSIERAKTVAEAIAARGIQPAIVTGFGALLAHSQQRHRDRPRL